MGQLLLTAEKLAKIMMALQSLLTWNDAFPRDIAGIRGKLQNHSLCIQRIRAFIVPFTTFIGGPASEAEWDLCQNNLGDIKEMAKYLILILPALAALGAQLWSWRRSPSTSIGALARRRAPRFSWPPGMQRFPGWPWYSGTLHSASSTVKAASLIVSPLWPRSLGTWLRQADWRPRYTEKAGAESSLSKRRTSATV